MRVLFVTSEVYPLVKTGGLGDVSYALSNALRQLGLDIRLLLPGYPAVLEQLSLIEVHEDIKLSPSQQPFRLLAGIMPDGITPVYVIECPEFYERNGNPYQDEQGKDWADNALRFGLLSKVAAKFGQHHFLFKPDLIHCNDWQAGLVPAFLKFSAHAHVKTVMSVHNMAYQGIFGPKVIEELGLPAESFSIDGLEYYGKVSFLKASLVYADWLTTVSPTYAKDIQTKLYGCGLEGLLKKRNHQLTGLLNGIDTTTWNPKTDPYLKHHYNSHNVANKGFNTKALRTKLKLAFAKKAPLIGMITRITEQKGIDLVIPLIPQIIKAGAQIAILGSGDKALENQLQELATMYPKSLSVNLGYDEELAHQIEAGADIFLMPSQFEPCGLNQMYSMHYGTIPIVRHTGGLADTVVNLMPDTLADNTATGFVFEQDNSEELWFCIQRALQIFRDQTTWKQLQINGMKRDFSWQTSAKAYLSLYSQIMNVE
jgi:starch synthase